MSTHPPNCKVTIVKGDIKKVKITGDGLLATALVDCVRIIEVPGPPPSPPPPHPDEPITMGYFTNHMIDTNLSFQYLPFLPRSAFGNDVVEIIEELSKSSKNATIFSVARRIQQNATLI